MRVASQARSTAVPSATLAGVYDVTTTPLPRRRRPGRTVAIVLGVMVAAFCAAGATSVIVGGVLKQQQQDNTSSAAPGQGLSGPGAPADIPGLNSAVRDGAFEFVVTSVTCGHTEIVNGWLRAQPQGQYCIAEMTVANIGREARHFADGSQRAYGPQGHTYAADTGAGVVANGNGNAWWNVVNPGNSIAAKVVFDLPPTGTISVLELHDSPFSGGVKVRVDAQSANAVHLADRSDSRENSEI
jgi:Domain of unknown function (DUF4352)